MTSVIVCPDCRGQLKLADVQKYAGRKIRCPKCKGIISVSAAADHESPGPAAAVSPASASVKALNDAADPQMDGHDWSDSEYADDDAMDGAAWDDEATGAGLEDDWGDLTGEIANCDVVDASELAVEDTQESTKSQMHIRQSIMDHDRYNDKGMSDYIPGLKYLHSFSGLFANAWVAFLVLVLTICIVLGIPLVMLYQKWHKDSGVADGDSMKILQTASNMVAVKDAAEDIYEGNGRDGVDQLGDRLRQNNQDFGAARERIDREAAEKAEREAQRLAAAGENDPPNNRAALLDDALAEIKPYPYRNDELARQRMKAVVDAFDAYRNDVSRTLPHASLNMGGHPSAFSWRVAILPFLDDPQAKQLAARFIRNVPWDHPLNLALLEEMPAVFQIPGSTDTKTVMHLFAGDFAALGGPQPIRLQQVTDGAGVTIGVFAGGPETAVPWTKPGGIEFIQDDPFSNLGTISNDGLPAVMLDGSTVLLSPRISAESFRNFVSHNDGSAFPEFTVTNDGTIVMGQTVNGTYYPGW